MDETCLLKGNLWQAIGVGRVLTELLTTADVASLVHAPADTVRYWRSQGTGPRYARIGKRVLYRQDDVERWIANRFE